MMKKTLIASLLGISLVLTACQTADPATTTPSDTAPAQTTAAGDTQTLTTGGADTSVSATGSSQARQFEEDDLTFATYDEIITFDLGQVLELWDTEFPSANITSIEFDFSDISWFYTVDGVLDGRELSLRIEALTGEIKGREEENDDDDDTIIDFTAIITLRDALEVAQGETSPDTIVDEWKLDWDWTGDDSIWYEFELENPEVELKVNAVDRTVVR